MVDMRRRSPEPPPAAPQIEFTPGLAKRDAARVGVAAGRGKHQRQPHRRPRTPRSSVLLSDST
jgi:hypothetical protein